MCLVSWFERSSVRWQQSAELIFTLAFTDRPSLVFYCSCLQGGEGEILIKPWDFQMFSLSLSHSLRVCKPQLWPRMCVSLFLCGFLLLSIRPAAVCVTINSQFVPWIRSFTSHFHQKPHSNILCSPKLLSALAYSFLVIYIPNFITPKIACDTFAYFILLWMKISAG